MNSLFLQGFVFSALVISVLAVLAWWLFLSPMQRSASEAIATSSSLSYTLALLIGIGTFLISVGGYWDASEHVITGTVPGGEDFLWPPHLMIYAGFLIAFLIAMGGLIALAVPNLRVGVQDPRQWVRRDPYVGAVVLTAGYGLFSIPGDAIWHELYGVDLTAWSPPHIFLMAASSSLPIFAAGLLLNSRSKDEPSQTQRPKTPTISFRRAGELLSTVGWRNFIILFYLALALNQPLIIGSIEWEIDVVGNYVAQRPIWLYPTIIGVTSFFVLTLARRVAPGLWTATVIALLYFGFRIAVSAFADLISGAPPRLTLVFILGALLLDLTARRMEGDGMQPPGARWMARLPSSWASLRHSIGRLAEAGAFTAGYALVALPTIQFYLLPSLPPFTVADHLLTILFTFLISAALHPLAAGLGGWLQHYTWDETSATQKMPNVIGVPAKG